VARDLGVGLEEEVVVGEAFESVFVDRAVVFDAIAGRSVRILVRALGRSGMCPEPPIEIGAGRPRKCVGIAARHRVDLLGLEPEEVVELVEPATRNRRFRVAQHLLREGVELADLFH